MDVRSEAGGIRVMRRELELAWAAGFFDGEGTTWAGHSGIGVSLQFVVGQKNIGNLHRFRAALGGAGRINGPNGVGMHHFRAYGAEAHECIRLLSPYLGREKIDQALRALIIYVHRRTRVYGSGWCSRGHDLALVGRYRSDCNECRRMRRQGLVLPPKAPPLIAIAAQIGVREYVPGEYVLAAQS